MELPCGVYTRQYSRRKGSCCQYERKVPFWYKGNADTEEASSKTERKACSTCPKPSEESCPKPMALSYTKPFNADFDEGLHLTGEKLKEFCDSFSEICNFDFWKEKVERDFGEPLYITPHPYTEEGYFALAKYYDNILTSSEEYTIIAEYKTKTNTSNYSSQYQITLNLPDSFIYGLAIATYVAHLPLKVKGVDLEELASDVLVAEPTVTVEDLEPYINEMKLLTVIVKNEKEQLAYTNLDLFAVEGFQEAFKIAMNVMRVPDWKEYFVGAYEVENGEIKEVELM